MNRPSNTLHLFLLLILVVLFSASKAHAQVPPISEAQARQELERRGLDEDEVRKRLEARGFDLDNLNPSQAPALQQALEEISAELAAEGSKTPDSSTGTSSSDIPEDEGSDSLDEQEQVLPNDPIK